MKKLHLLKLFSCLALLTSIGSLQAAAQELTSLVEYKKLCQQQKPIMILFYADWCGACKAMKEPYDKVADATSEVIMVKVNVKDENLKVLQEALCVTSIPTIVTRQSGALSEDQLINMVSGHVRKPQIKPSPPQPQKKA